MKDGFIVAVPKEDSDITANAFTENCGNINIITQGIFGIIPAAFTTSRRNIMTNLNVPIPDSLYKQIEALAIKENVSIEQLVAIALSAQVSA